MGLHTLEQLYHALERSGLPTSEAQALVAAAPEDQRPRDAATLAQRLVERGTLTAFQVEAVMQGRPPRLVLGNYVLFDAIGSGGMGEVYKATHRRMNRVVAVKVLKEKSLRSPELIERFHREVQAAARLLHPNIVAALDADEAHGVHYLVMEYVAGRDLSILVPERPFSAHRAVVCAMQAARGLEYAHAAGVVHRDIKPANLLMDAAGTVKISDLGIARLKESGKDQALTQLTGSGVLLGTIDFMAPEQANDTAEADARSDIYSLGCTLYYLLVGEPPFASKGLFDKIVAHREEPIPLVRVRRADVPESVDEILQKMAAKAPEERFQSMADTAAALEELARELPHGDPGATIEIASVVHDGKSRRAPSAETLTSETTANPKSEAFERLRRFIDACAVANNFLDTEREHAIFRQGADLRLSLAEIETTLDAYCHERGWSRQTVLSDKLKAMLHEATKDDGRIDQGEFEHVICFAEMRNMPRVLAEEHCATLILDNNWPVKAGWLNPWFTRLLSRHGLN